MKLSVGRSLAAGLLLVGAIVILAFALNRPQPENAVSAGTASTDADPVALKPPVVADGHVIVGGVERSPTDVQFSNDTPTGRREPPKKRQGFSPSVAPNANEQVALVAAALRSDESPERFSSFVVPHNFDASAFENEPEAYGKTYASIVEPGRVFSPAQPGEGVRVLRSESKKFHRVRQGETVRLAVEAIPFAPVTFSSQNLGQFENQLTSFTAVAGEDGVATANFTASGGTIDEVHVLAASPVTSGQVAFVVSVNVPPR